MHTARVVGVQTSNTYHCSYGKNLNRERGNGDWAIMGVQQKLRHQHGIMLQEQNIPSNKAVKKPKGRVCIYRSGLHPTTSLLPLSLSPTISTFHLKAADCRGHEKQILKALKVLDHLLIHAFSYSYNRLKLSCMLYSKIPLLTHTQTKYLRQY